MRNAEKRSTMCERRDYVTKQNNEDPFRRHYVFKITFLPRLPYFARFSFLHAAPQYFGADSRLSTFAMLTIYGVRRDQATYTCHWIVTIFFQLFRRVPMVFRLFFYILVSIFTLFLFNSHSRSHFSIRYIVSLVNFLQIRLNHQFTHFWISFIINVVACSIYGGFIAFL